MFVHLRWHIHYGTSILNKLSQIATWPIALSELILPLSLDCFKLSDILNWINSENFQKCTIIMSTYKPVRSAKIDVIHKLIESKDWENQWSDHISMIVYQSRQGYEFYRIINIQAKNSNHKLVISIQDGSQEISSFALLSANDIEDHEYYEC